MPSLAVLTLLVAASRPALVVGTPNWELVDTALSVAERSIAAIGQRRQYLFDDVFLGLRMVMDQLQIVVHRLETSHPEEDAVGSRSSPESVLWRRALVRSKALVNATSELFDWGIVRYQKVQDPLHMKVMLPLVRPGSWSFDFPELHVNNSLVTSPGRERTFSEAFSDSCVYQLTRTRTPDECKISNPCFDFMTQPHTSHYWLTHQVFYTLIGIKSECRDRLLSLLAEHQGGLKSFLIKTCSNVMRDALNAKDEGFPETLQDLFIEQIGFCGMAGFPDFYRPDWIRTIQSWEREDGCFSDHRDWDPQRAFENHFPLLRNKRSEIFLKDDCRFHKTILGAITMTTGLKFLLS
ncbi:UPF0764 protein C16orf89 isoform X2 [Ixodes scapularis]|uniref:UPF0764 protein C16orf89 isoform X2 n=1 Tax=Ixodes scapularis TaxID=6945 RepID=UPI001A9D9537|nr:UPF0764 protein C16orf89 isoform X2 [Ixodes scapularis]